MPNQPSILPPENPQTKPRVQHVFRSFPFAILFCFPMPFCRSRLAVKARSN